MIACEECNRLGRGCGWFDGSRGGAAAAFLASSASCSIAVRCTSAPKHARVALTHALSQLVASHCRALCMPALLLLRINAAAECLPAASLFNTCLICSRSNYCTAGVDVAGLLAKVGLQVTDTSEKVGTFAIAYAAHKALSPVRFPPTVALTPLVAKWTGMKKQQPDADSSSSK